MKPNSTAASGGVAIISGLILIAIAAVSAPISAAIRKQPSDDDLPSPFAPPAV